jgi:hypothetical protein
MDEKKVIETTLTEYENEQLKLLKSVFDMGCAFKMLALQKEASDWELKYLNEKKDFKYAQEQIGRFIVQVDLLKKELAKKESDTAREIFEKLLCYIGRQQQFCIVDEEHKTLIDCDKLFDFVGNLAKEEYGVDLGE